MNQHVRAPKAVAGYLYSSFSGGYKMGRAEKPIEALEAGRLGEKLDGSLA